MKKILTSGFIILGSFSFLSHAQTTLPATLIVPLTLTVQPVITNVEAPTAMTFPEKDVIWLLEQKGFIRVIRNGKLSADPLLDLRSKMIKVNDGYEERGLLGIALHPKFSTNKKFYVFYS